MSRIGKAPIALPDGVEVKVDGQRVSVKGPKGELSRLVSSKLSIKLEDGELVVSRPNDTKESKSMHGLYRSLVFNMVEGVSQGYKKELELVGVGFKAAVQGDVLEMSLGFSHTVFMQSPEGITLTAQMEKNKAPVVIIEGADKELVGQVAAKIVSLRPVEPYKGKGVRFVGQHVRRKAGKAAAK